MRKSAVVFIGCLAVMMSSCGGPAGVDTTTKKDTTTEPGEELSDAERALEPKDRIEDKKTFGNGIRIQWFEKGDGEALQAGSVYELNYKIKLENGEIVDGNHLLKKDWIPFMVGFQMQTIGWDMALTELHVGDFVEVYLPAKFARGEKGIPGVIPPNSPNILFLRIGKKILPSKVVDGVKVWTFERNEELANAKIGETSEVAIDYFVGTKSNPMYDNSYQRNLPFTFRMTDASLIPGLRKGLMGSQLFDKAWIIVPAKEAYGSKGYVDLVKPNEDLFYQLFIMDVDRKGVKEMEKAKGKSH